MAIKTALVIMIILYAFFGYKAGIDSHSDKITTACTTEGQFTVSGRTYRCGVIEQETIQQSKARKFEQCRAWLHNALREPNDPN